jgi:hypothetical protein
MTQQKTLYIFLDEGGNFDFSSKGTRFFTLSCVTIERPFAISTTLDAYRYDCIEYGLPQEFFHCTDDNTHVRRQVFERIGTHLPSLKIDALLINKRKTCPQLQEPKAFYPKMLGYLIRYVIDRYPRNSLNEIIVITDTIPINEKRKAVEKAIKLTLAEMLPADTPYRILHHSSRSHYGLQVADYCNWAILRKWERQDTEHYQTIKPAIRSEFDIFKNGFKEWY